MTSASDPLKEDFRVFLFFIWRHLRLPPPTKRQLAIAAYLQHGPKRKMIEAFRGVGKSWITVAFVLWRLYVNPEEKILVVSASKQLADNFTTFALNLIDEIEFLQVLRAREGQRKSKIAFDVGPARPSKDPSVRSAGITGQITGSRASLIVPDDIETPNNSATQMMREKLAEQIKEFDAILLPQGEVAYLGTPQTESSVYNLLSERGYSLRVWPARYPTPQEAEEYGGRLAPDVLEELEADPSLAGKPTEPTRFTEDDLLKRELSYGRAGFALQFMLNTRLSDEDRYPLKLRDLIIASLTPDHAAAKYIWSASPEWVISDLPVVGIGNDRLYRPVPLPNVDYLPYTGCVLAVDPSGRGKDETGYAVVAILHSTLFLLDAGGFSDGYSPNTLQALAKVARKYMAKRVIVEANFGDGMFSQLLKPVLSQSYPCTVEEVKHSIQKERRIIDTLEPVISSHRMVVDRDLIQKDYASTKHLPSEVAQRYQLFYQLTRITREKGALMQDDRLDALSIGVGFWTPHLAQDIDRAVANSKEAARDKELRRFMDHAILRKQEVKDGRFWTQRV
jgi:hypothetical protein